MRGRDRDDAAARGVKRAGRPRAGLVVGFIACSWLLALVAIWAVQQVHQGLHEHQDLAPILHWLRDAALAVPLAALAIGLAALMVGLASRGAESLRVRPTFAWLAWAAIAAITFAALSIPGNQLHGLLFGAEEEGMGWLEDVLLDGSIVLLASLVVLVPVALLGARTLRPAERPQAPETPRPTLTASAGASASLSTMGSTHAGGNR